MAQPVALAILVTILFIGDLVSVRTKAWVSSVFISALLFLIGYWTFFPKNIVEVSGISGGVAVMLMYLLITNLGTLLSFKELLNQWKTIVISLSGIIGMLVLLFTIGYWFLDLETILVAGPPLVGGIVSALIMSEAAQTAGLTSLSVLAILIYVMQGFAGYPLTSVFLKKEGRRLLKDYREGSWKPEVNVSDVVSETIDKQPKLFAKVPIRYNTNFFKLARLAIIACLAYLASTALAPILTVSPFVLCLLFGVIASSLGFLETKPLEKANGQGFAIMGLMLFIFDGIKNATPKMLQELVGPMVLIIVIGVIGMYIFSFIAAKILKISTNMAFAVALTALYGFPADYIITNEVVAALTEDEEERIVLRSYMLPPMLVGGFISVTMVSVVLAGIFAPILIGL